MINVRVLQKSLSWIGAALVTVIASQPCSDAALAEFPWQPITWLSLTPGGDPESSTSRAELSRLSTHDVVLIIDKSHSMARVDCLPVPSDPQADSSKSEDHSKSRISRWRWCQEQTLDLTERAQGALPAGITVVLFSDDSVVYSNVNARAIESIFSDHTPKGNTNTTAALKSQLDQYFERRDQLGQGVKPLLIAVITDGCPDDPSQLRYAIINATRQMTTPDEIAITFLQVGNDFDGSRLLKGLDSGLVDRNAQFDIVDVRPFVEMRKIGLARALVNEVAKRSAR